MSETITAREIQAKLDEMLPALPLKGCPTCECMQDYLKELASRTDKAGREVLQTHMVPQPEVHACLGCHPCPPADELTRLMDEVE